MKRRRRKLHVGVQPGTLVFAVILAFSSVGCSAAPAPPEDEDPSPATAAEVGVGSAAPVIAAIPPERRVGREPIRYVGNIYKYYIAYGLLEEQKALRRRAISETVPDEG